MKLSLLFSAICAALLATAPHAVSQTTYSLVKASVSLPGYVKGKDAAFNDILTRRTLNTKSVINLARSQPLRTAVPRNIILVGAAEAFKLQVGIPTAFRLLVIDNTNPAAPVKIAEILKPDTTTPFLWDENHISARFFRVGVGRGEVISAGNIIGGNKVQTSGTLKRKPTPTGPQPIVSTAISGQFMFRDDDGVVKTAYVLKGKFTCSGKVLPGTLTF